MRKKRMNFKKSTLITLLCILSLCLFLIKRFTIKHRELNVILIVIDSLRADHLGCYGYTRDTSPNIDKFAKEGLLFSNAFSQSTRTQLSVSSILTSLYTSTLYSDDGILKFNAQFGISLPDKFITLPEILQKTGRYTSVAFVAPNVAPELFGSPGFAKKFQFYDTNIIKGKDWLFGNGRAPNSMIMPQMHEKITMWLKEKQTKPFFLYIHYLGPHHPYLLPPPYNRLFWQDDITEGMHNFMRDFIAQVWHGQQIREADMLSFIISQYDGGIRYTDDYIKSLLEELEDLGLDKNTLVILTADHGEAFQEHGEFFHGHDIYDELIHVPLIMRLPGILPQNKVIHNLVRQIDIVPTVLNILDISFPKFIQGVNLMPLIQGKKNFKLDVFSEIYSGRIYSRRYLKGIRTEKWKTIQSYVSQDAYSYELYDLENDPKEINNLANINLEVLEFFKTKLKDYTLSCKKIRKSILGKDYVDKPVALDEGKKELLRNLGYLQ